MTTEITKKEEKQGMSEMIIAHISSVADETFNTKRFAKMAVLALADNPVLGKATPVSVVRECVKLARLGLHPDGRQAALVPFRNKQGQYEAQAMPMVSGLLQNARQSGEIKSLAAFPVYENEEFSIQVSSNGQEINHVPIPFGDRGDLLGVYAMARLKNGDVEIEVMNMEELAAVEKASRAKFSPWKGDFRIEMMRKSVLRRLLKRLPAAPHMDELLRLDNEGYSFDGKKTVQAEVVERPLMDRIEEKQAEKEPEVEPEVEERPTAEEPPSELQDLPI